jgi:hypothetical protein
MSARRYRAFISYSHRDEDWARWLHRALESYRIPRKLVGTRTPHGEVPRRLVPIFRDRDELSSAADLPGKVKEALAASSALIVICSPRAAASTWVNQEISEFRRLGRGGRIFALIVEGDPQASDESACFPSALLEAEGGERFEPLAADARKWADGRLLAKLKLLSGILGIPLDSLRRRDLQKRQRTWVTITIAVAAIAFMATLAVTSRIAAEKRRVLAQELVGFKLSDLSGKLRLPEDVDILGRLAEWDEDELTVIAKESGVSSAEAIAAALDLNRSGKDKRRRGDLSAALEDFRRSWATLAVHYQRESADQDLLFELGQAEFWIGNALVYQGAFEQAALAMGMYADISRRLLRSQPENGALVLEMAYALTNLGRVEGAREASNPERALQFIQAALEFNQIALVLDPQNEFYRTELEQSHADVADAQLAVCDLGGALHSHMESARLAREFHDDAPDDFRKTQRLAFTLGGIAEVQASIGLADMALDALDESAALLRGLAAEEPGNADLQHVLLERRFRSFRLLARLDRQPEARELSRPLLNDWQRFLAEVLGVSGPGHRGTGCSSGGGT